MNEARQVTTLLERMKQAQMMSHVLSGVVFVGLWFDILRVLPPLKPLTMVVIFMAWLLAQLQIRLSRMEIITWELIKATPPGELRQQIQRWARIK